MTPLRGALALLAVVVVVGFAWWLLDGAEPGVTERDVPGERVPYAVEVLNGTDIDGLARAVTFRLRRAGIDVVAYGTSPDAADSTLIVVRGDDPAAGTVVRDALGVGRVVAEPDPRLLLDVSVILGRDAVAAGERRP